MRLNGWQRIGVVVSVVWMIGGTIWGVGFIGEHSATALSTYKLCLADHDALGAPDLATCSANYQRDYPSSARELWLSALVLSLSQVLLLWITAYGIRALVRWVQAGFHA